MAGELACTCGHVRRGRASGGACGCMRGCMYEPWGGGGTSRSTHTTFTFVGAQCLPCPHVPFSYTGCVRARHCHQTAACATTHVPDSANRLATAARPFDFPALVAGQSQSQHGTCHGVSPGLARNGDFRHMQLCIPPTVVRVHPSHPHSQGPRLHEGGARGGGGGSARRSADSVQLQGRPTGGRRAPSPTGHGPR